MSKNTYVFEGKTWLTRVKVLITIAFLLSLSACVTQNFAEDKPVVERDFSNDQIAQTRISLALGYLKIGNMTSAKINLEKAKKFSPDLIQVHTAFAHYYEMVGEFEQTEEAYQKALSIKDDDADTLNNFGVFLCRQDRVEEAEKYFLRAIKVPSYVLVSESYENIALCHLKENNFDRADWALERSIAHSPNSASSLLQMAQLKYAMADYSKSAKFISRYEINTRRFSANAIALAYKVNKKLGKSEVADNYSRMLISMFPESVQAKDFIANELYQTDADIMALEYRKYKLLKSGVKINKKPIISYKKMPRSEDGFKQSEPSLLVKGEKLVNDAEIIAKTNESISANSQIESQTPVLTAKPVTVAPTQSNTVVTSPIVAQSKQSKNAINSVPANTVKTITPASVSVSKPIAPSKPLSVTSVPVSVVVPSTTSQTVATATSNTQQPRSVNIPAAASSGPKSNTKSNGMEPLEHIVQRGENLYQISLKYNIAISTLRRWNNLISEDIQAGQLLRLTKPE